MDLSQIAVEPEVVADFEIVHPKTGDVIRNDDGTPWVLKLRPANSDKAEELKRSQLQRRLKSGRNTVTPEQIEAEQIELLVSCTAGWTIPTFDGADFPYSEQNARRLYGDQRFRWLRDAANRFIAEDGNFMKSSSKPS